VLHHLLFITKVWCRSHIVIACLT